MRRLAIASLLLVGGCLRIQYDRCADLPPHPDCADGGRDAGPLGAGIDAEVQRDAGEADAKADDGGAELDAAGDPPDAGVDAG